MKRETYYGGHNNGVCVKHLMDDSEDIIHELLSFLNGCSRGYVTDENVGHVFRTHAKQFRQFDGILLCLDTVELTH